MFCRYVNRQFVFTMSVWCIYIRKMVTKVGCGSNNVCRWVTFRFLRHCFGLGKEVAKDKGKDV